jgi:hypothetical protein
VQMWQGEPLPLLDEVAAYALGWSEQNGI